MTGARLAAAAVAGLFMVTGCSGDSLENADAAKPEVAESAATEPEPAPEPDKKKPEPEPVDPFAEYEAALNKNQDAYVAALVKAYPGWRDDTDDGLNICQSAEAAGGKVDMASAAARFTDDMGKPVSDDQLQAALDATTKYICPNL